MLKVCAGFQLQAVNFIINSKLIAVIIFSTILKTPYYIGKK